MWVIARRARFFLICVLFAGLVAAAAWYVDRGGASLGGSARVIDGDSLMVAGSEIRLFGIDAPELRQTCTRAGRTWSCGAEAAQALRRMVAGRELVCHPRERDRYDRTIATCRAGELDVSAAMVRGGYAVAYGAYETDEREAREARRGLWAGEFDMPAAWRARHPRGPR
ncbi:MAG: thermonuclease family protein [Alphaproteobacteria bacterium]